MIFLNAKLCTAWTPKPYPNLCQSAPFFCVYSVDTDSSSDRYDMRGQIADFLTPSGGEANKPWILTVFVCHRAWKQNGVRREAVVAKKRTAAYRKEVKTEMSQHVTIDKRHT